jgi:hypothetical protein
MPVEMRREAAAASPDTSRARTESGPGALRGLVAARLVTHEAIGDPGRLVGEAATLRAICRLVSGPIYRIEPFHYAFSARPDDLDGALAELDAEAQAAALDAALAGLLGAEAVWIGATDLVPEEAEAAGEPAAGAGPLPEAALLALRARDAAVAGGIAAADPGLQAVVDARYAVACARLTAAAEAETGPLADRLGGIEAALGAVRAALAGQVPGAELLAQASETLGLVLGRLEAQSEALRAQAARQEALADRLAALAATPPATADFEARLSLTLAEFLARLERRAAEPAAPLRAPQVG